MKQDDLIKDIAVREIRSGAARGACDLFLSELDCRRFAPDNSVETDIALKAGVQTYFRTGCLAAAERAVLDNLDLDSRTMEVVSLVNESSFLARLSGKLAEAVASRMPDAERERAVATIGRAALYELVEMATERDHSRPLDIGIGKSVTACYIPGASAAVGHTGVVTTNWGERSSALSIMPDRTFRDFLRVVGVSKQAWLDAVAADRGCRRIRQSESDMPERAAAWAAAPEWEIDGGLGIDIEEIVAAVDACPHGFTPVFAFNITARQAFALDFTETLEVSGGIVGLHDFRNGAGDPQRFEGTVRFTPRPGDLVLADDRPLGLIATHGFRDEAFRSEVTACRAAAGRAPGSPSL